MLNTYFRELIRVDSAYTRFSDGMLDYYVKKSNGASELYVKQSRAFRLDNQNTEQNEKATKTLAYHDIKDAVKDAYNFKYINQMLKLINVYDYNLKTKTDVNGRQLDIVTITPKPGAEYMLKTGTVAFDHATNLIIDIDVSTAESKKQYSREVNIGFLKFQVFNEARRSVYKLEGEKYLLVYNQNRLDLHLTMGEKYNNRFEFMNDMVVLDYKEGEFELDRKERFKGNTLFDAGTNHSADYWNDTNVMLLTNTEQELIKPLNTVK